MVLKIGQMRSVVVFKTNTPTTSATGDREAVETGGQNDVYTTLLTTRGRLRKKSGGRNLDFGLIENRETYELICRYQSTLESNINANMKVDIGSYRYTVDTWERVDEINHLYKFDLNVQKILDSPTLGSELITNGDFSSGLSSWNVGSGWSSVDNKAKYAYLGGTPGVIAHPGGLDTSKVYRISIEASGITSGLLGVYFEGVVGSISTNGVHDFTTGWNDLSHGVRISFKPTSDFDGSIDNVSVKEIISGS